MSKQKIDSITRKEKSVVGKTPGNDRDDSISGQILWIGIINMLKNLNRNVITFFSSGHGIVSRINSTLVHKTRLHKFKKVEITSRIIAIFSDHNDMRREGNYKKKTGKKHKCAEIKQHTTD